MAEIRKKPFVQRVKGPQQVSSAKPTGSAPKPQRDSQSVSPASIAPARRAAFEVLEQVARGRGHSDDLLHGKALTGLGQADRNLATALVLGVLRWQIALEHRLLPLLQRPDQPLAGAVQTSLFLGAFQLLYMDRIPAHAALSESVELVRWAGQPQAAGMVNAVLRKLSSAPKEQRPIYESIEAAAARLSHPGWLVERWSKRYGRAAALAICEYDQREPERGHLFDGDAGNSPGRDLPEDVGNADAGAERSISDAGGSQAAAPRMDDGSRLVAELAALSHPRPASIWDCCAAPGGKTLILTQRQPGAKILATDVSPKRLQALTLRLRAASPDRAESTIETRIMDATTPASPEDRDKFDLILCDVPCSGTGTLARNPEIRQRLRPSDLATQAERQVRLLRSALERLAPGGLLLYSTCSLEPEENEAVVEAVTKGDNATEGVQLLDMRMPIEALEASGRVPAGAALTDLLAGPFLRTLPGYGFQGDGFFAALFGRA